RHGAAGSQFQAAAQSSAEAATAGTGPHDEGREGGQRAQGETGEVAILVRREERLARPRAACRSSPLAGRARTPGGRSPRRRGLAAGCHREAASTPAWRVLRPEREWLGPGGA